MKARLWMELLDWSSHAEADLVKLLAQARELGLTGASELDAAAGAVWDLRRRREEELVGCDA